MYYQFWASYWTNNSVANVYFWDSLTLMKLHCNVHKHCDLISSTTFSSWWRHDSSNGTLSTLLAHCEGNPPVNDGFPHKGQWHGALMCPLMSAWTNGWTNSGVAGDSRRHNVHVYCDVTEMCFLWYSCKLILTFLQIFCNICNKQTRNISTAISQNLVKFHKSVRHPTLCYNWPNSQIPQYTYCMSHNAPFRAEICTFCSE